MYRPDDPDAGNALGWYGEWRQAELDVMLRMLREGATVLEAGSGCGAHAVPLGNAIGAGGHLLVAEADAVPRRLLAQNLAFHDLRNATVLRGALEGAGGGADAVDGLWLERLDWLKVGAGADAASVIAGARDTLWRLRPCVLAAVRDEAGAAGLAAQLAECGYRCWRHTAPLFDAANFNGRTADIFGGRVATAVLALPEEIDVAVNLEGCVALEHAERRALRAPRGQRALGALTRYLGPRTMIGGLRRLFGGAGAAKAAPGAADARAGDPGAACDAIRQHLAQGRVDEAMTAAEEALRRFPTTPAACSRAPEVLAASGRHREALDAMREAERHGMQGPALDFAAGSLFLRTGDPAQAEARMRAVVASDPESASAHAALGTTLYAQRRLADAVASYRRALDIQPDLVDTWHLAGDCLLEQNDPAGAEACLRRAVALDEGRPAAARDLATALDRQQRHAEALQTYARAVALADAADGDDESFVSLANALLNNKCRGDEAIAVLEEARLPRVPSVDGHYAYAIALLTTGRMRAAWDHSRSGGCGRRCEACA